MTAARDSRRDPVCGMTVSPDTELRHVHAGAEYLFCSAGCRENSPKVKVMGKYHITI